MWILKQKDADAYYVSINGARHEMTTDPEKAAQFEYLSVAELVNIDHGLDAEIIQIAEEENGTQ